MGRGTRWGHRRLPRPAVTADLRAAAGGGGGDAGRGPLSDPCGRQKAGRGGPRLEGNQGGLLSDVVGARTGARPAAGATAEVPGAGGRGTPGEHDEGARGVGASGEAG